MAASCTPPSILVQNQNDRVFAHYDDFTDLPFLTPLSTLLGLSGDVNSHRVQEIVRAYTRSFFDQHLKGMNTSMFQQPAPDFPEVQFENLSELPAQDK